ncbi:MAG: DUF1566 domain-containing protein [Saprospiraceae bacterium]
MKKTFSAFGVVLLFVAFATALDAQPAVLSVQGVLRKSDGKAVDDGVYTLKFKLWKHPTSTNASDKVWEDSFSDVEITGGVYNVLLGTGPTALDVPFDQTYYLGISMSAGSELQPRPMLTSAPFVLSLQGQSNILPNSGPMGIGTARPDTTSALLMVESTSNGVLIPRITQLQRNGVAAPADGLLVFQTDNDPGFYFRDNATWRQISNLNVAPIQLGTLHEGGYVFYVDETGQHGLAAAPADVTVSPSMGPGSTWFWNSGNGSSVNEANGTAVGVGYDNTRTIVDQTDDYEDLRAAWVCHELVADGYSDWFLPSKDELSLMYQNLRLQGIGNFVTTINDSSDYWSSSSVFSDSDEAWYINFGSGTVASTEKNNNKRVRPVRAF